MDVFELFDACYDAYGAYESMPDGMGGMDIRQDGMVVDHMDADGTLDSQGMAFSFDNVEGGTDIIANGKTISHSKPNLFGGTDVYDGTDLVSTSIPNAMGGVDIYDGDMSLDGFTIPNVFGGEDFMTFGNTDTLMSYDDPLSYSGDFSMAPLTF